MKISYNWLKNYLNIDYSVDKLSVILTDIGLEVEGIEQFESIPGGLNNFVIAKVLTCKPHPNADKLSITTVDLGDGKEYPIVCGAPNVAAGQTVVVAKVGAKIYKGEESFDIKKAKIRGEVSEGMICAEDEIGIGNQHEGIFVIENSIEIGSKAADYFKVENDTIFEIGLTPNRADATSHLGVARDLMAYFNANNQNIAVDWPNVDNFKIDNENNIINIEIDNKEACKRYTGITISNIEIKESPDWLQNRLKSIGLKPINNIVDITNFILHEMGQPLHAFDADKIEGKKVIVKTLAQDSPFITLDEQERKLHSDDLMICNTKAGMCIAGVFGGATSGVTEKTKNIFLESAYFNPVSVRKTSKRHALQTDASFRFERGTDPNITVYALKRAAMLIKEIAGGEISSPIIDIYPKEIKHTIIPVNLSRINRLLGVDIEEYKFLAIVKGLEMKIIEHEDDDFVLSVPPYRVDVQREVDIAEDLLRIYGYNNVEYSETVKSALAYVNKPDKEKMHNTIADLLSARGFNEMMNNSLSKDEFYKELKHYNIDSLVHIENPLSADLNVFRQSLIFGTLQSIAHNIKRSNYNLHFYEFGTVASKKQNDGTSKDIIKGIFESQQLAITSTGNQFDESWKNKGTNTDFYSLKAQVDNTLERLGIDFNKLVSAETTNDIFDYGLNYSLQNSKDNFTELVNFGKLSTKLLKQFEIEQDVYYAELNWTIIQSKASSSAKYKEPSKFPVVKRDLALLLDKNVDFKSLRSLAFKTEKKLLTKVNLFDVFEDAKLGENKKSYALSFHLQDKDKTLNDKQIDKVMNKLIQAYTREFSAQLR